MTPGPDRAQVVAGRVAGRLLASSDRSNPRDEGKVMVRRDAGLAFIGPGPPARIALPVTVLASREAALDPTEEAARALGPGALAHDPQPELPAVAGDDPTEAVPSMPAG